VPPAFPQGQQIRFGERAHGQAGSVNVGSAGSLTS
jgi:hypothetical protein